MKIIDKVTMNVDFQENEVMLLFQGTPQLCKTHWIVEYLDI